MSRKRSPSWVPDWSLDASHYAVLIPPTMFTNRNKSSAVVLSMQEHSILAYRGNAVGTVHCVFPESIDHPYMAKVHGFLEDTGYLETKLALDVYCWAYATHRVYDKNMDELYLCSQELYSGFSPSFQQLRYLLNDEFKWRKTEGIGIFGHGSILCGRRIAIFSGKRVGIVPAVTVPGDRIYARPHSGGKDHLLLCHPCDELGSPRVDDEARKFALPPMSIPGAGAWMSHNKFVGDGWMAAERDMATGSVDLSQQLYYGNTFNSSSNLILD